MPFFKGLGKLYEMENINHEIGESIIFLSVLILLCKILTYEEYQNCYGNT